MAAPMEPTFQVVCAIWGVLRVLRRAEMHGPGILLTRVAWVSKGSSTHAHFAILVV